MRKGFKTTNQWRWGLGLLIVFMVFVLYVFNEKETSKPPIKLEEETPNEKEWTPPSDDEPLPPNLEKPKGLHAIETISKEDSARLLKKYTALHDSMTSFQHPKPRFLVFGSNAGLGNKELGLVSAYLIALLTDRALLVDSEKGFQIFQYPFQRPFFDDLDKPKRDALSSHTTYMVNDYCFLEGREASNSLPSTDLNDIFTTDMARLDSNCPLFRWIARNPKYYPKLKEMGIIPKDLEDVESYGFYAAASICKLFLNLTPYFQDKIDSFLEKHRKPDHLFISVQIRMGSLNSDSGDQPYINTADIPRFYSCVQKIAQGKPYVIFLAADQSWIYDKLIQNFNPADIVRTNGAVDHTNHISDAKSQEWLKVVMDHYIPSFADELVITTGSTFGSMPAVIGGKLPFVIYRNEDCVLGSAKRGPGQVPNLVTW